MIFYEKFVNSRPKWLTFRRRWWLYFKCLLTCSVTCSYDDGKYFALEQVKPVDKASLWWDPVKPEQMSLFESTLTLSEPFFNEIVASPIPLRMETLKALRKSPMAIDLYCWLTYRNFYSKRSSRIPWEALQNQFGAGYPMTAQGKRDFKKKFLEALSKLSVVYPEAKKLQVETEALIYVPGRPDVLPIVPIES